MIVIPALDVRGGRCVRLLHGDFAKETVYDNDCVAVIDRFISAGARRVHIVDLDAARGKPDPATTKSIAAAVSEVLMAGLEVQIGGGIRTSDDAGRWFARGVTAVAIGSVAMTEPALAKEICQTYPNRVLLALDVRNGIAQSEGWTQDAGDAAVHLSSWSSWPSAGLVQTSIERDGALTGPDLESLSASVDVFPRPVIASGGISSIDDISNCAACGAAGVIVGRAIFEDAVDLANAVQLFPGSGLSA